MKKTLVLLSLTILFAYLPARALSGESEMQVEEVYDTFIA